MTYATGCYGASLRKEQDFSEYLKSLSASRILVILRELLSDKEYADRVKQEKYEFLRTKEFYKRCMDIAHDKWEWNKKSF